MNSPYVTTSAWQVLRQFTAARIGLGRAGISLPTSELLAFQLAHAQAQDAVHLPLHLDQLSATIKNVCNQQPINLHSEAKDRFEYLQRPDLGRSLNQASRKQLQTLSAEHSAPYDLAIVVIDGLSSLAVQNNSAPMLSALFAALRLDKQQWNLAPLCIALQGRVALGDEVGEHLNANAVLVLIGERPGLSSPDSLGIYLTWRPRIGRNDAERNCISNVRPEGLGFHEATERLMYLLKESRQRQLSGVNLKDRTSTSIEHQSSAKNFLVGG